MKKSWLIVCLVNFLIAALMGLLLRFAYLYPVNINYQYLVHAHSHTAMLGWAYMMIFSLIVKYFIPAERVKKYNALFWLTQATVAGMMISFPFQGYALFSIAFSTSHIFCSYYFFFRVSRDLKKQPVPSYYMLKASLLFLSLSTLGAWCLGTTGATGGKSSPLYYSSLQFFLHFQFNGWLIFAVLALLFKHFEQKSIIIGYRKFLPFFILLIISTVLTFALPLSWYYDNAALPHFNALGIIFQLLALALFIKLVWPFRKAGNYLPPITRLLLLLPLFSFFLKMSIQTLTILPQIAVASHTVRNFTVGFIHLAMLGIITGALFYFIKFKNIFFTIGVLIFYLGFISSEILLFLQGFTIFFEYVKLPHYFELLFISSTLLPTGLSLIIASSFQSKGLNC
jgi:hypothetical protein